MNDAPVNSLRDVEARAARSWRVERIVYMLLVFGFPLILLWIYLFGLPPVTVCIFRVLTGYDCPGCGMTRAFREMVSLDVLEAFRYNPLGPVIFLVVAGSWLHAIAKVSTKGRYALPDWWKRRQAKVGWLLLWVYLGSGLLRLALELSGLLSPVQ